MTQFLGEVTSQSAGMADSVWTAGIAVIGVFIALISIRLVLRGIKAVTGR